jgi:hypothetical protein
MVEVLAGGVVEVLGGKVEVGAPVVEVVGGIAVVVAVVVGAVDLPVVETGGGFSVVVCLLQDAAAAIEPILIPPMAMPACFRKSLLVTFLSDI